MQILEFQIFLRLMTNYTFLKSGPANPNKKNIFKIFKTHGVSKKNLKLKGKCARVIAKIVQSEL